MCSFFPTALASPLKLAIKLTAVTTEEHLLAWTYPITLIETAWGIKCMKNIRMHSRTVEETLSLDVMHMKCILLFGMKNHSVIYRDVSIGQNTLNECCWDVQDGDESGCTVNVLIYVNQTQPPRHITICLSPKMPLLWCACYQGNCCFHNENV